MSLQELEILSLCRVPRHTRTAVYTQAHACDMACEHSYTSTSCCTGTGVHVDAKFESTDSSGRCTRVLNLVHRASVDFSNFGARAFRKQENCGVLAPTCTARVLGLGA